MHLLFEFIGSIGFVLTGGLLFPFLRRNPLVLGLASIVVLGSVYLTGEEFYRRLIGGDSPASSAVPTNAPRTDDPKINVPTADEIFWFSIKDSSTPDLYEEFLRKFPNSRFAINARDRLAELRTKDDAQSDTRRNAGRGERRKKSVEHVETIPNIEKLYPPDKAVTVAVRAYNPDPYTSDYKAEYSVTNSGLQGLEGVRASLWALTTPEELVQVDVRTFGYIGQGEARVAGALPSPILRGKFLFCVSYVYNGHSVELLDFFSDEGQPPMALLRGYPRYRSPLIQVDGRGGLCHRMPQSAEKAMNHE